MKNNNITKLEYDFKYISHDILMDSKRKMKNFSAEMNPNTSTFTE
jgi:hypothetical protein